MSLDLAIIVVSAIFATAFPILYTVWANWWRSAEGRHLFFMAIGMAALYDLTLAGRWLGQFAWFGTLATLTLLLLCYQLGRRLWLLVKYNLPRARAARNAHPRRRATDES